jgi:phosphatidate cytidylyltransferase
LSKPDSKHEKEITGEISSVQSGKNSELRSRVIYGLLLAVSAFALTWLGGFAFQALVGVAAIIMFDEYRKICRQVLPMRVALITFAFIVLNMAAWIVKAYDTAIVLSLFAFVFLGAWEFVIKRTGWGAIGLVYVLTPFFALVHLRSHSQEGYYAIILLFALVWGADTMAYVVGKSFGGPKLIPKISPGKTWSGFFGGLFGGLLIGWQVMLLCGYQAGMVFVPIGLMLVFLSQIGDLAESALKRRFDVKDSGTIIPGHGGVLDRVDGLVFTSVVAWVLALYLSDVFFGTWTWEPANAFMSFMFDKG